MYLCLPMGMSEKEIVSFKEFEELLIKATNTANEGITISSMVQRDQPLIFVNDGFSVSHRAHSSVEGITRYIPSYAGLTLIREVEMLSKLIQKIKHNEKM